jgi:hypothetical protein
MMECQMIGEALEIPVEVDVQAKLAFRACEVLQLAFGTLGSEFLGDLLESKRGNVVLGHIQLDDTFGLNDRISKHAESVVRDLAIAQLQLFLKCFIIEVTLKRFGFDKSCREEADPILLDATVTEIEFLDFSRFGKEYGEELGEKLFTQLGFL